MKASKFLIALMAATLCTSEAKSEIVSVTLAWTPGECIDSCVQSLQQQFQNMPGAAKVTMNGSAGQATINWTPNVPFSYTPVQSAMAAIGLYLNELRVRVRGTIQGSGPNYTLVSLGDNTSFALLNPPALNPTNPNLPDNVEAYQLTSQTQQQLAGIQTAGQIVTIEGPIFDYWRSPPMYLIIEYLTVESQGAGQGK